MPQDPALSRRNALKCMAYGGAGTLFALSGGIFTPIDLAMAAADKNAAARTGQTLVRPDQRYPHRFQQGCQSRCRRLARSSHRSGERHARSTRAHHSHRRHHAPVEAGRIRHGATDCSRACGPPRCTPCRANTTPPMPTVTEYFSRFGKASDNKGYYSFDHAGVHFIGLINVLQFKPGGLGNLGAEQLAWVAADLQIAIRQHADRSLRPHAALVDLRALGLGHGRCGPAHEPTAPFRLRHRA